MLRIFILFFYVTTCINLSAQKKAPVGTIWLRDNVYIDQQPVATIHYREYEYALRKLYKFQLDSLEYYVQTLPYYGKKQILDFSKSNMPANPDSAQFIISPNATVNWPNWVALRPYVYGPKYNYYPVVQVSKEIAIKFCRWRTAMVQMLYSGLENRSERTRHYRKIKYRLPTAAEWNYAIEKFSLLKELRFVKADKGDILPELKKGFNNFLLAPLSELVSDSNIVKGRNWKNPELPFTASTAYIGPTDWIGFRCVCEVED